MSTTELESKCRELRQLQALITEAEEEAESIKDAIKAFMGDCEAVRAGEYGDMEVCKNRQNRHQGPFCCPSRCGESIYQRNHHEKTLRGIRKAPLSEAPTKLYGYRSL